MNERDETLLQDMLSEARRACRFIEGKSRGALEKRDMLLGYALVRAIEIVGEAASKITPETRAALRGIRWVEIVGMRNRVVHDYSHVDYDVVWQVVKADLPPLIAELENILPADEQSDE